MRTAGTGSSTMADEISYPHDSMVRAVLGDVAEARGFLQRYVPEELSQTLNWSTLRLGDLNVRQMQLLLLAAYHPRVAWMEQVSTLLSLLLSLPPSGGVNNIRVFVRYFLSTQEPEMVEAFREVLRQQTSEVGEDLMTTYAQELLAEGEERVEQKGTIKTQVEVIEGLLREGVVWSVIERATGINETQFQGLKQQVEALNE